MIFCEIEWNYEEFEPWICSPRIIVSDDSTGWVTMVQAGHFLEVSYAEQFVADLIAEWTAKYNTAVELRIAIYGH